MTAAGVDQDAPGHILTFHAPALDNPAPELNPDHEPDAPRGPTGGDDLALVAAYRRGDSAAFDHIFSRYEARIRGMCWRYMHDVDVVDDLVQETFCHLIEAIGRIDEDHFNLSAWIHRIAANLCLDELRRRARRQRADAPDGAGGDEVVLAIVDDDRWGHPEEAVDAACTRTLVWEAVNRLPDRQREVLILREVRGFTHAAISAELKLAPGAVQGVLHRARERFKHEYVTLEGLQKRFGECAKVGFLMENLGRRQIRRDRLASVERHLRSCEQCRSRFSPDPTRLGIGAAPPHAASETRSIA
jgi:RNA polymerase sigma-70 factor (ECF subfamily)